MKLTTQLLFSSTLILFLQPSQAKDTEKKLYEGKISDSHQKKEYFKFTQLQKINGNKTYSKVVYHDLNDKLVLIEEIETINDKLNRYIITQHQIDRRAEVIRQEDKLVFNLKSLSENTEIKSETKDVPDVPLVVGSSIFHLVTQNWQRIAKGKDVDFSIALWARQDTIGFYLRKKSHKSGILIIEMLPSNFFIRQFVDTIEIVFNTRTEQLVSYKGRTNLMIHSEQEWNEFDGFIKINSP